MRNLIVFGLVGLALGLAVQNAPRVLGWGDAHAAGGGAVAAAAARAPSDYESHITARAAPNVVATRSAPASSGEPTRDRVPTAASDSSSSPTSSVDSSESSSYTLASELTADRVQRLVEAGFSRERAEELLRTESQLRRAAVESEYAATGTIRALNGSAPAAVGARLRKELGDEEYARYLEALGEPTRIRVPEVDPDSVAANAGIQPGDEIITYAGKRVFNPRELNSLMLKTAEGETVATTVLRDGQPLQLYVTGGALGIAPRPVR